MNTSSKPKIYVTKSSAKEHQFNNGGSVLKLSFDARELAEFAKQHQNERGWLNLVVAKRRTPGERGDTHSIYLDEWKPNPNRQSTPTTQASPTAPIRPSNAQAASDDDVPF